MPEDCAVALAIVMAPADNAASRIDPPPDSIPCPRQDAELAGAITIPASGSILTVDVRCGSGDLPSGVDRRRPALIAPERPEIDRYAVLYLQMWGDSDR